MAKNQTSVVSEKWKNSNVHGQKKMAKNQRSAVKENRKKIKGPRQKNMETMEG